MIIIDDNIVATRTCIFSKLYPYRIIQCGQFSAYHQPSKMLYFVKRGLYNLYEYDLSSFTSGSIAIRSVSIGFSGWDRYVMHVDENFVYLLLVTYPIQSIVKYNRSTLTYNSQIDLPPYSATEEEIINDCCGTGFILTYNSAISVFTGAIETFGWFEAISYNPVLDICLVRDMEDYTNHYIVHNFLNGQRRFVKLTFSNIYEQYNLELVPSNTQILLKMWQDRYFRDSLFYGHNPLPMNSEHGKIKIFAYNEISETTADVIPLER